MMEKNIEIEFKNMLTKTEYNKLLNHFQVKETELFKQENHYFDTKNFELKERSSALRIRKKQSGYELTLKQPCDDGLLETNKQLTVEAGEEMIQTGKINDEQFASILEEMGISPESIVYFGSLSTIRAEKETGNGLLVFDHSFYLNIEDYELEYEVSDRKEGQAHFQELLDSFQIPIRETKNKVRRFYEQKYTNDINS
ncbi:CYTH domain-containing protein [Niallia circulans]|uniref:CYTH domain-containing protein n=2 Tax=Niallia circulans TaxID=1397 RepID=A0A553SFL5_NIACI|nr:CYTH domain-containing protein [Niallia circulans]